MKMDPAKRPKILGMLTLSITKKTPDIQAEEQNESFTSMRNVMVIKSG